MLRRQSAMLFYMGYREEETMRYGFTTGSCAAAAAKGAAYMLLTGNRKEEITIGTPRGVLYPAKLLDIVQKEDEVICAVEKDGGDDPDVTSGAWIYAAVSYGELDRQEITIEGGKGVGTVTRPGLDQPIGAAAINHVPRQMIEKELLEVCRLTDYQGSLHVVITVPEGEKIAKQTFNPRLGIVGGISIIGTSGIVEPMSSRALLDTIQVELRQRRAEGFDFVAVTPGNYGRDFMEKTYGYDLDRSIKCSNFIGETIDMAVELGFQKMLLTGHIGKLIKVAGGIMNTHSREADCRLELLAAFAIREGAEAYSAAEILKCATAQEAIPILMECGILEAVMKRVAANICDHMEKRAGGRLKTDCIIYANEFGELAKSKEADQWFILLEQEQERQT